MEDFDEGCECRMMRDQGEQGAKQSRLLVGWHPIVATPTQFHSFFIYGLKITFELCF